jgi:biotin carboxylase
LSEFDYPVIVKPIDAYSGRGVSVVREPKQLHASIQYAEEVSRSGRIVLEQFVEGQLCSHSAFVENGEIVWDIFVDEFCFFNPYAVDNSFVRYDFPSGLAENVRSSVSSIVSSLQVEDGLFHTQFIYDDKGFWFIEVTRRCPGDLYSRLVELSTGMPYATYYASFMVGAPFSSVVAPNKQESRKLVRHTVNLKPCQYMGALLPLSRTFLAEFIPLFGVGARDLNRTRVGVLFLEMEEGFSQSECVQLLCESRLVVKKL